MAPQPQEKTGIVRVVSPELQGGRSYAQQRADLGEAIAQLLGDSSWSELTAAQPENQFDPKTRTWTDAHRGTHTQKCPIRTITDQG